MSHSGRVGPAEVMERYVAAVRAGDLDRAFGLFAEDIVFRVPGSSPLAGEHHGREATMRCLDRARALSHRGEVEVEVVDALVSDERFALIVSERFGLEDGPVEIRRANVYRVRDGEIVEIWIFEADQAAVDALFALGS